MGKLYFFRKGDIKMDFQDTEREGVVWIHLGQDTEDSTVGPCEHGDACFWQIS
jgi:hypothetical protein